MKEKIESAVMAICSISFVVGLLALIVALVSAIILGDDVIMKSEIWRAVVLVGFGGPIATLVIWVIWSVVDELGPKPPRQALDVFGNPD